MRQPSTPMRRRAGLFAAVVILLLAAVDTRAVAEDPFARLFVFGDSYTDVTLAGVAATTQPATPLKLWRVYPLPLQEDLGIDQIVPFGVGGARASPIGPPATVNPPGWHLQQQVDAYLANGNLIGPRDLVTLNIGGNDGLALLGNILTPANNAVIGYPGISIGVGNAATFANITADFATAQIERLVASGARNFVLGEFSGLSGLPRVPCMVKKSGIFT